MPLRMAVYLHFPIRLNGMVRNLIQRRDNLASTSLLWNAGLLIEGM
jgi:hypothetical protein